MTENASTMELPVYMRRDGFGPAPELTRRRDEPLGRISIPGFGDVWLVTRYEDVRMVLSDTARFSNNNGADTWASDEGKTPVMTPGEFNVLIGYDPPDHTRVRRLLTPEFTMRRLNRLRPRIEAIVTEHLEAMAKSGDAGEDVDLVQAFSLPIPSLVICELLGVPYEDRDHFHSLSTARLRIKSDPEAQQRAVQEFRRYMAELIARKHENPDDSLIGMLIIEHQDALDDQELVGLSELLLVAGHETTANMLALGTLLLLQEPERASLIRDQGDEHVNRAVEEMLRYLSVVHGSFPRWAKEDTVLADRQIRRGDVLLCSFAAANRDPALMEDPERLDLTREAVAHVAFGHGIHHCLGAPLARMEMRVAFPALLRRFPTLRVAVPYEQVPFRQDVGAFGLASLPVAW